MPRTPRLFVCWFLSQVCDLLAGQSNNCKVGLPVPSLCSCARRANAARQGSLLMMPPGLGWILVYDAGSYCCTDRQWKRQPGTLEALNGKQAKQRVAMWDIPHRYSSGMSKCFTMAHTFSQFTLSLSHAGQDNERESDDDAHMGDDPGAAGANSNGSTDQALRSAWEHDLPPGSACR